MQPYSARRQYSNPCLPQYVSSSESTPSSSAHFSPTVDLPHEYTLALRTNSFNEIWSIFHHAESSYKETIIGEAQPHEAENTSKAVLNPSQECVQEAFRNVTHNKFTSLVTAYFDQCERTSHLCLLLHDSIVRARVLYLDIHKIIESFPLDSDAHSLTESECDWAFNAFLQFDQFDNPFLEPGSESLCDIRECLFHLHQQINQLRKSRTRALRICHATTCSATCFVRSLIPSFHSLRVSKEESPNLSQLNAVARGTLVLHDLDTIDRLVDCLFSSVEGDKFFIRLGLDRGRDRHPIHEVVKQLKKNKGSFLIQLMDLKVHICLCLVAINRARRQLLDEMCIHQSRSC